MFVQSFLPSFGDPLVIHAGHFHHLTGLHLCICTTATGGCSELERFPRQSIQKFTHHPFFSKRFDNRLTFRIACGGDGPRRRCFGGGAGIRRVVVIVIVVIVVVVIVAIVPFHSDADPTIDTGFVRCFFAQELYIDTIFCGQVGQWLYGQYCRKGEGSYVLKQQFLYLVCVEIGVWDLCHMHPQQCFFNGNIVVQIITIHILEEQLGWKRSCSKTKCGRVGW